MDGRCALESGNSAAITPSLDGFSLPGWIYRNADFLEVEKERVFATSWQIVCHLSDIPHPGDYHTLDFLGKPLVAVRIPESRLAHAPAAGWRSITSRLSRG